MNNNNPNTNPNQVNGQNGAVYVDPATGQPISSPAPAAQREEPVQQVITSETNPGPDKETLKQEKLKNIQNNYKAPSKFKTFMLIVFFILLIAFIFFLPEIQVYFSELTSGKKEEEEITTGKLVCTLDASTTNLTKEIERVFTFTDKKLQSATFTTVIKGDPTKDEDALNEANDKCVLIKKSIKGVEGISVECKYEEGKLEEIEKFDYKTYEIEKVRTAYSEAGGEVVEYDYGHDIDKVMTSMRQGGFTCNKEK